MSLLCRLTKHNILEQWEGIVIQDVQVIPLRTHQDDRGFLTEIIRVAGSDEPHAVAHKFGQVYLVGDPVRGAIRAYHKHAELWDWPASWRDVCRSRRPC